jgi:hypothetical protein
MDPRTGLDGMENLKFFVLPGLELRPFGRPSRNQLLYRLCYRGSVIVQNCSRHSEAEPSSFRWGRCKLMKNCSAIKCPVTSDIR